LLTLGLSPQTLDRRVRSGRLYVVHRGVYAVGHPVLTREGRWMAAVLVAGAGAVLSHGTAAAAWDLRPPSGAIHVTVPGTGGRRRRAGLRIHRSTTLDDTTSVRGIPVTGPLRTIVDLATVLEGRPLEHALDLADQRHLVDFAELRQRPLPRSLQAVLSLYAQTVTRSELEECFLALCDAHRLPRPMSNVIVQGREVDFVWQDARLIVEVDGYRYHRSPSAFEDDRERDVILSLAGWTALRFTYAQIVRRRAWVAAAVADRLAR
jgi:very-short-patch-repair endonuclease